MYKVRMSLPKFKRSAFIGLDESIESLGKRDQIVHLAVIETEGALISLWIAEASGKLVAIVAGRFNS